MDIGLSISLDFNSEHKIQSILAVSKLLENGLKDMDYSVINHYWILCKVQKTIGVLEQFASVPRHRFVEHLRVRNLDNSFTDYYGVYTCGFKIDFEEYDAFIESTDVEAKRTIARKVVESLANLDNLSKKAAGFDKDRFKADVIRLFQKYDLL